jgi:hypothetical protein
MPAQKINKFIVELTEEDENKIIRLLNGLNILTTKIGIRPIYLIKATEEQANYIRTLQGVQLMIRDRSIPTDFCSNLGN